MSPASSLFLMIAIGVAGIALGGLAVWAWLSPGEKVQPLPDLWAISPRPVFNASERRLYRQLKDAFPHHVVMPKLPLVRLCQPEDREKVEYWYGLLGSTHATFTITGSNGKAVLAIDLESRRARSKRTLAIKEAVLNACQIRYFSIAANGMPTLAALQLLLPQSDPDATSMAPSGDASPAPRLNSRDDPVASPTASGQLADETDRWQDSSVFMDSFFAPDGRMDPDGDARASQAPPDAAMDAGLDTDIDEVAVDGTTPAVPEATAAARGTIR